MKAAIELINLIFLMNSVLSYFYTNGSSTVEPIIGLSLVITALFFTSIQYGNRTVIIIFNVGRLFNIIYIIPNIPVLNKESMISS